MRILRRALLAHTVAVMHMADMERAYKVIPLEHKPDTAAPPSSASSSSAAHNRLKRRAFAKAHAAFTDASQRAADLLALYLRVRLLLQDIVQTIPFGHRHQ